MGWCTLASMDQFRIELIPGSREGVRILQLWGPFVLRTVFEFQTAVRAGNDPVTIVDLSNVPFMDSAALGAVVGLHVSSERQQRKYALVGISGRLRMLFQVAGVEKILVTYATVGDAEQKLTASAAAQ